MDKKYFPKSRKKNFPRTEINYWTTGSLAGFGLVKEVMIYDDNTNALQKKSVTNYKDDAAYLSRRIIGLPLQSELYDGTNNLMAKVTYNYDERDFTDEPEQNIAPNQHDNTNFGAAFIIGRGNPTSTIRWSVDPSDTVQSVTSKVRYDVAGSPVAQLDPLDRKVKINYADKFNDDPSNSLNRNTFAYPTTLTDPDGKFSSVKYRYDIGANVWAKSPAPANQVNGKETTRTFDSFGRLERQTLVNNGAYTRYEYPTNQTQSKVYSTITAGMGEVLAESWTDGAGRVRQSRTELPNSAGGWSGSLVEYDILGRVTRTTVPTEINAGWTPAGDDAARGFLWQSQEYDWKGRVTKETNTDGTFKTVSYEGCGCAGGQVTTIQGEEIVEKDWQGNPTNTLGRRTQKVSADILGRSYKTEILNWNSSVYSTTVIFM